MPRLTGYIFDVYDDVDGRVLRSVAPSAENLPDFVKVANHLSESQRDHIPDTQFALVLVDEGTKLKKYAMTDKGNTALSVLYLLKQAHLLPPIAVKTAARNLMAACSAWEIEIPEQLKVAAEQGQSPVSARTQRYSARTTKVAQLQFHNKTSPQSTVENPILGKHDGANADVDQRTNMEGSPGNNFMELPAFPQKEKVKTAAPEGVQIVTKQKSWRESPYVDMSNWDPSQAVAGEIVQPHQTLLEGQYPVDGYDQVKTASAYFENNWRALPHKDRHEYCVKLASRMEEMGLDVPVEIQRYGSNTYASDVDSYVEARRGYVHEEHQPLLDLLLEKRAQVSPDTFADTLAEFDTMTGLRWNWDAQVADPWYSTFGPSLEKVAADDWRYNEGGTRICEGDLNDLALNDHELVAKAFGEKFADEFQKKPKTVFESLPKHNKLILARMASDRFSGVGNV